MKDDILNQYRGFINTPNLWKSNSVLDLEQFEISDALFHIENPKQFNEIRLGKRVEQFFNFQVKNSHDYKLLASNLQIKNKKLTIGELDALVLKDKSPIHIEIVYKFYLYDPDIISNNPLNHWIGPNRKDTLVYKLSKLKEKQLPLLYSDYCKPTLEKLELDTGNIKQNVYYKAQLFLPYNIRDIDISPLNNDSIYGFYLPFSNFEILNNFKFYIPKKLDWLTEPSKNVDWMNFENTAIKIKKFITEKRSPMVWIKNEDNQLQKCFITFW